MKQESESKRKFLEVAVEYFERMQYGILRLLGLEQLAAPALLTLFLLINYTNRSIQLATQPNHN